VLVQYRRSDFMQGATDELAILAHVFTEEAGSPQPARRGAAAAAAGPSRETTATSVMDGPGAPSAGPAGAATSAAAAPPAGFNALVDLCGIFKKTSIHEVRSRTLPCRAHPQRAPPPLFFRRRPRAPALLVCRRCAT
jgi:hypothetical protein